MMKASDLVVRCLENEGVEYIFGIPGEENLDCPVDYSENDRILRQEIKERSAAI